tara:strand:- start:1410 stop:1529 length:120 start_codon:yes stop_codon:yes gene_type:complete
MIKIDIKIIKIDIKIDIKIKKINLLYPELILLNFKYYSI